MSQYGLNIQGLDQWIQWLDSLERGKVKEMKSRILRSIGLRGLEIAQDNTPRQSGRLQNSLSFGDRDNAFQIKVGNTSYVFFGTVVEYAAAVENGYRQEHGRFVPGFWRNGVFFYVPQHRGGMVLTGKIIPGAHMFQKAIDGLESDVNAITEFEFRRLYAELFRG